MKFEWIAESPARWDAPKAEIVGGAAPGIFGEPGHADGDLVPSEWWHVEADGEIVGFGWMDVTWAEAEILLAVAPAARGKGVGSFILDRLEDEARARGLQYLYNVVRPTHPDRDGVTRWLTARKFEAAHDDDRLVRRVGQAAPLV